MKIIENNNEIKFFMGTFKASNGYGIETEYVFGAPVRTKIGKKIKYHSSWDWLMPVVEKIEKSGYYTRFQSMDNGKKQIVAIGKTGDAEVVSVRGKLSKIDISFEAIVQFIQWYNTQS